MHVSCIFWLTRVLSRMDRQTKLEKFRGFFHWEFTLAPGCKLLIAATSNDPMKYRAVFYQEYRGLENCNTVLAASTTGKRIRTLLDSKLKLPVYTCCNKNLDYLYWEHWFLCLCCRCPVEVQASSKAVHLIYN